MTIQKGIPATKFNLQFFSLSLRERPGQIHITMTVNPTIVTTTSIPCVRETLQTHLPGIFSTKCFNYQNQSFYDEVINTELAHLFEHIILEKFCELKAALGYNRFIIRGNTEWNWHKNPKGTFLIKLSVSKRDRVIFYKALRESIILYNRLMNTCIQDNHVIPQFVLANPSNLDLQYSA
jgi:hypothetical protein